MFLPGYHVCVKSNLRVIRAMHDCQMEGRSNVLGGLIWLFFNTRFTIVDNK